MHLPGFWYRKNLGSLDKTLSTRVSKDWMLREDRLSTPLVGGFDRQKGLSYSFARMDEINEHTLAPHEEGEIMLSCHCDIGGLGFSKQNGRFKAPKEWAIAK